MIACLLGQMDDALRVIQVYPDFDSYRVVQFLALAALIGVAGIVAAVRRSRVAGLVCGIIAIVPGLAYLAWLAYLVFALEQWQDANGMCLGAATITVIAGSVSVRLACMVLQRPRGNSDSSSAS